MVIRIILLTANFGMVTKGKKKRKTNRDYWVPKIERTIKRDKANVKKTEDSGYKVFRFWEHEIKKDLDSCFNQFKIYLTL